MVDIKELEQLIKEYLCTLPDVEEVEWYGTLQRLVRETLLETPEYDTYPSFLEWLKERQK